jgi:thymidylate synthase
MYVINARNVNDAYASGVRYILEHGTREKSRNGDVIVAPGPVCTVYARPRERVLFDASRDANPFFHLMEALWMLAGERAAAWPVKFNKQMAEYANDDGNYDGAYGYRWRKHFGIDQILWAIDHLLHNPESRRCVITMFDGFADRSDTSRDIPCNTHLYLDCRNHRLNMTVCNRSNDAIWGAYGANAVHFSMLQEVIAAGVSKPVGEYRQISNNLHIYTGIPKVWDAVQSLKYDNLYSRGLVQPWQLVRSTDAKLFLKECELFLSDPETPYHYDNQFFYYVARPVYMAWKEYKAGDYCAGAMSWADQIEAPDWRRACQDWLIRRQK